MKRYILIKAKAKSAKCQVAAVQWGSMAPPARGLPWPSDPELKNWLDGGGPVCGVHWEKDASAPSKARSSKTIAG
jgi:hypothetical protein